MSPRPTVLAVANRRKAGCGTDDAVLVEQRQAARGFRARAGSRTSRPGGRHRIRRSTSAMLFCTAQGRMPSRNSVICLPSLSTIASLPTRSIRETWLSRLTRTQGQFSRAAPARYGSTCRCRDSRDHDAAIAREARQNGQRRLAIEQIIRVKIRHMLGTLGDRPGTACRNRFRKRRERKFSYPAHLPG